MIDLVAVLQRARSLLGLPYHLGGRRADPSLRSGLDCSELTAYAYEGAGINLPWNAQAQYNLTQPVTQPQPGDLVFFAHTVAGGDPISHVGIYLGGGQMLNAQDSGVAVANLNDQYWRDHFVRFGRVPGVDVTDPPGAATAPASASPVALPDTVGSGAAAVPNPLDPLGGLSDALQTIVGKLTARDTYIRLALVVIGGAFIVGGAVYAVSQTETGGAVIQAGGQAVKTAGKAAVLA